METDAGHVGVSLIAPFLSVHLIFYNADLGIANYLKMSWYSVSVFFIICISFAVVAEFYIDYLVLI